MPLSAVSRGGLSAKTLLFSGTGAATTKGTSKGEIGEEQWCWLGRRTVWQWGSMQGHRRVVQMDFKVVVGYNGVVHVDEGC